MSKKRITGRFYVFVLVIAVIAFLLVRSVLPMGVAEAVIMLATATDQQYLDAVIVRDETVVSYAGVTRIAYVAAEGSLVEEGDEIAYIYSAGYSEREMERLESTRQEIQEYHKELLSNIVDAQLETLDEEVLTRALDLKALVSGQSRGNLLNLTRQLESAMLTRQEYLRQNKREDLRLNQLYEEEASHLNAIASWRTTETAPRAGVVSFYMDGYEELLTVDNASMLTASDVKNILSTPANQAQLSQAVFRVVDQNRWYLILLASGDSWNPINGQEYSFQFEGYEDLIYNGTIVGIQQSGGEVAALLEVTDPIDALIYRRSGKVIIGTNLSGLSVPNAALVVEAGQTGVRLSDIPGGTFVPVEVLSRGESNTLIKPVVEGALAAGQRVLLK
ncbi:MAG TPA: hypothetical protein IAA84_05890 [Candidatus Alectryocaccomicrobium excrementavium]|uniref:RND related barrel-sandwich hybrid domain-containing protein n=1 Tax=Candidatus Alectryocaccomicrobium excrementavium TaxID=2840668 RepID=A0A9D1K5J2_9FIRM|nr:hypothetical protein [Candidatus Alectryocaccomicrobium excrementavium]